MQCLLWQCSLVQCNFVQCTSLQFNDNASDYWTPTLSAALADILVYERKTGLQSVFDLGSGAKNKKSVSTEIQQMAA